jgi:hypothetical protein
VSHRRTLLVESGAWRPRVAFSIPPQIGIASLYRKKRPGQSGKVLDFGIGTKVPEAILSDAVQLTIELDAAKQ